MVDGAPEGAPPVKRKRGRPRKADVLAAQAAAAAAAGDGGNGVIAMVAAAPSPSPAVTSSAVKSDPKPRKPRKKKGEIPGGSAGVDANLVGKTVTGVLDGSFDAGYLLTVRVGDSETFLRGVVFGPGLTLPVKDNDIAPHAKHVKRDESIPLPPTPTSVLTVAPVSALAVQAPAVSPRVLTTPVPAVPAAAPATVSVVSSTPAGGNATFTAAAAVAADGKAQQQPQATAPSSAGSQVHPTAVASAPLAASAAVSTGA